MMTERKRSAEIIRRFQRNDALNLSAVKVECPALLEGLFEAGNFRGWKESLELAGVSSEEIRIEPMVGICCKICGFEAEVLRAHLEGEHGMSTADYREEFPGVETASEAFRAEKMSQRHGRPAKSMMPHWEPAWSRDYALDRLHEFSKAGIPLNYQNVAKHEPGFASYVRRIFRTWYVGLEAAGIDPAQTRLKRERRRLTAEEVVQSLRQRELENPEENHISKASSLSSKVLFTAAFRNFGSFEAALTAAGIDPAKRIPALGDPAKVKKRQVLIDETERRIKDRLSYDLVEVKGFIDRHAGIIKVFYGSWFNFTTSLKLVERDVFNSPEYQRYDAPEAVVAGLRERESVGLGLQCDEVRVDNPSLLVMAEKHFKNFAEALSVSGLTRKARSYDKRFYPTKGDVIAEICRRRAGGESLLKSDLDRYKGVGSDRVLVKWSLRHFGSYAEALAASGVSRREQVELTTPTSSFRFPDGEAVIAALKERARAGLPLTSGKVSLRQNQGGNRTLVKAASRHFGGWKKALKAAGL